MSEPRVMAMLLTADRPEMTKRSVECFRAQTYENKRLMIFDTGLERFRVVQRDGIYHEHYPTDHGFTIGALRNLAMAFAHPLCLNADIIVHFDSDDWSHANRITEQVALLQASGADCVGYNELLFWKSPFTSGPVDVDPMERTMPVINNPGEAWLYSLPRSNYALGTSLCYWRKTWEKKSFQDTNAGEDYRFIEGLNVQSVTALPLRAVQECKQVGIATPMMVASVHGGNTVLRIDDRSEQWKRVPEWDARLCGIMAL